MKVFPRQKIYGYSLFRQIKIFFSKKKNCEKFIKKYFELNDEYYVNFVFKARIGLFHILKYLIKNNNSKNKILLSSFTVFDMINMVLLSGFEPIFIDHYKNSPEIDLKCLKKNIDNYGNRIGAVLLTHYNVNNSKLDDIVKICKKNNIMLIEDCAISIGSKFKNDYVGKFGDFSIFSFGFYKFINVLSGGMIFSKNKSFYNYVINEEKTWKYAGFHNLYKSIFKNIFIRIFTSKIIFNIIFPVIRFSYENNIKLVTKYLINDPKPHKKNDFPENYKYRLSELQKNDIVFQLDRIEYQRKIRKKNYFRYLENIKNKKIKFFHNENSLLNENAYLNFPIIIQTKEHFMNYMLSNGIDLSPQFYRSVNTLAFFKDYADKTNLIQETVTNLVFLPTYDKIENKYIDMTIDIINEY